MILMLAMSAHAAAPDVPTLSAPLDGSIVADHTPELRIDRPSDPDGDVLSTTFFLETLQGEALYSVEAIKVGPWASAQLQDPIAEDSWTCWYAQVSDGAESSVSETACFFVTVTNDPPTAPQLVGERWVSTSPTLQLQNGVDAEERGEIQVLQLTDTQGQLLESTELSTDGPGLSEWSLSLDEDTEYILRAQATDGLRRSEWTEVRIFASDQNHAPSAPRILSPAQGGSAESPLLIQVRNAQDPEGDALSYRFELKDADGEVVDRVEGLAEGQGTTEWAPTEQPEGRYTVQAWAEDGEQESEASSTRSFFIGPVTSNSGLSEGEAAGSELVSGYYGGWGCSSTSGGPRGLAAVLAAGFGLLLLRRRT